jgi:hypothetical protein
MHVFYLCWIMHGALNAHGKVNGAFLKSVRLSSDCISLQVPLNIFGSVYMMHAIAIIYFV